MFRILGSSRPVKPRTDQGYWTGAMESLWKEELLLYHRLCWLRGGYGVRVSMHHLPGAIFGSKGHRDPQIAWGDLVSAANLCIGTLYPQNAGKLRCDVLCYSLEVVDLTISEYGCSTVLGLRNLLPSARGRAEGVGEGYVFSVGEKLLYRLWVPFHELLARLLELFEYSVEIIYSSQLEITSILDALSFPWTHSAGILLYSPNVRLV